MKAIINHIFQNRYVQHLSFWGASLFIITYYFSISNEIKSIDIIYSAYFHLSLVPLVYINTSLLIPLLLSKRKYLLYALSIPLLLILVYYIHELVFNIIIPRLPFDYFIVSFSDAYILTTIFCIYLFISSLLKLSKAWFQVERLHSEATQAQLYNLQLQINPHFLMNTLNSIYGLALKKDDKTPASILKLSEILKYVLYQKDEYIDLSLEIEIVKHYIELQQLRLKYGDNVTLTIDHSIVNDKKIIPFLLLTFVENAFKHGDLGANPSGFISISLQSTENDIDFTIKNSYQGKKSSTEGIGLTNAKNRLNIYYLGRHQLNIDENVDSYTIQLTINSLKK
ncbi:sensor histidine kinase [Fulvivirga ligni]|uniref:sensor histidine kinase n=1 Tax=Fulvivirga ligni TaxID=2904246 RepID=UPI001F27BC32|nr:histidine kinase [Fulvivirga ligni]UII19214.1 histidine kinase [Fulvivirga ligni]